MSFQITKILIGRSGTPSPTRDKILLPSMDRKPSVDEKPTVDKKMEYPDVMEIDDDDDLQIISPPKEAGNKVKEKKDSEDGNSSPGRTYKMKLSSIDELNDLIDAKLNTMDFLTKSDDALDFLQPQLRTQESK